ncbi:C40 family peptidase [Cellulomonas sp. PS-H5]|uniref:C40 family peptidase n=1 Tax=Cellulomonas sp. PS-H5 TaxID=2820400 RepID=UPI001C4EB6AC|nr:C40 family peptidase [Cellulomonas sp. PS-H5]MBW0255093.1 C40 family peptidase [Cellulomonas sp. PS-H5]
MTASAVRARHRSARRPVTPLTDLATAATGTLALAGRRTAVVAATTGLMVSAVAVPAANAATASGDQAALPSVDTAALTASAKTVLETAPVVTAPADAAWSFETPAVTAVVPEPEPEPEPVRTTTTSRSAQRAATAETATATAEVAAAAVPQSVAGNAVLEVAARYVGVPYVSGGTTPAGFDCSGFVSYVYAQLGISLPRTSSAIKAAGTVVSASEAQPGDLIWSPGHISIYAGGDQQIDSPRPGKTIQFRSIWQSNPTFIRIG